MFIVAANVALAGMGGTGGGRLALWLSTLLLEKEPTSLDSFRAVNDLECLRDKARARGVGDDDEDISEAMVLLRDGPA